MSRGLANTKRIKLAHFDTLVKFYNTTTLKTATHGSKPVRTLLDSCYCNVDYLSRKQEEKTIGGRERSVQQAVFLRRYHSGINKKTEMEIPATGEVYEIIGIHRDKGRLGQFLECIGEVRD